MLEIEDYKKINRFKDIIHKHHFFDNKAKSFRERAALSLGGIFGYQHVIYGYIDSPIHREITFDVVIHNIESGFAQRFLTSSFVQNKAFYDKNDVIVFSETPNYQKRSIYKELLSEQKFSDFMLFYLTANDAYIGYIIVFKEVIQKVFTAKDKEIAENIRDFLGVEYYNYFSFLSLKSNNDLLITQTHYYPVGIVIMKNFHELTFANETAKEYLSELELTSLKFFSMFFTNHILPHIKYELRSVGKKHIIRYKNFIFSVVALNSFSESYFTNMEKSRLSMGVGNFFNPVQDTTNFIYILKDELSSLGKNKDFFADYSFTKKEEEIVELILLGKNNKQIAEELNASVNTIRVHIQKIYKKTAVSNRTEFLFKLNNS